MRDHPHRDKLIGRMKKYPHEKELLKEIMISYNIYKERCLQVNITDKNYLPLVVSHLNGYLELFSDKKFQAIRKNSRNKIYPSILEEFMCDLFKPIIKPPLVCGSATIPIAAQFKAYNDVIACKNYEQSLCFETTDADCVIGVPMTSVLQRTVIIYPIVVLENKRYADKTMRGTVENTAAKVKTLSRECIYLVVVDLLSGFFAKNYTPANGAIDQIYGLREGNSLGNESLRVDVVFKLFMDVANHLNNIQKFISLEEKYKRGYMVNTDAIEIHKRGG